MNMSKTVAVLFGGQSSEHPVSLMSAASILRNMPEGYETYLVGITRDGRWYHYQGSIDDLETAIGKTMTMKRSFFHLMLIIMAFIS